MAVRAVRQYSGLFGGTLNVIFDIMLVSAPANNTVGFIGLGNMGRGMAENLVTKVMPLQIGFSLNYTQSSSYFPVTGPFSAGL